MGLHTRRIFGRRRELWPSRIRRDPAVATVMSPRDRPSFPAGAPRVKNLRIDDAAPFKPSFCHYAATRTAISPRLATRHRLERPLVCLTRLLLGADGRSMSVAMRDSRAVYALKISICRRGQPIDHEERDMIRQSVDVERAAPQR